MTRRLAAIVIAVAMVACSEPSAPEPPPTLTGSWVGVARTLAFEISLTDNEGSVHGSGVWIDHTVRTSVTITGNHVHPAVTLTMTAPRYEPINFVGRLRVGEAAGAAIEGRVSGSGFDGDTLVLGQTRAF